MIKNKLKHSDIPTKQLKGSDTWIYHYREIFSTSAIESKPTGYVYLHEHEKDEIIYWLNRLCMTVTQKWFLNSNLDEYSDQYDPLCKKVPIIHMFLKEQPKLDEEKQKNRYYMGKSKYADKNNSILSFASGIVDNIKRNPDEDLGKAQLKYIIEVFDLINTVYHQNGVWSNEVGYSHLNRNELNERPLKIKFKEA